MGPDAKGEYVCMYCGTRFHRASSMPAPTPGPIVVNVTAPTHKANIPGVLIAAGLVGLITAAVAYFVLMAPNEGASVGASARTDSAPARSPERVLTPAPIHTPPTSVSAEVPAPTPEPAEVAASATFEFHGLQSGYKTSFYALGFVTNTSPFVIDKPKVIAVLLDAQGNEVGTDFGFAERDVLAPNERSPIKILVSEPPEHASIRYEVIPRKASYIPAQVAGLRVEPTPPRPTRFGKDNWEVEGKVHNEGQQSAKFVSIEIQALDADGKLVGLGNTYADAEVLAPGAVARFSTQIMLAGKAERFEFTVGSRLAD